MRKRWKLVAATFVSAFLFALSSRALADCKSAISGVDAGDIHWRATQGQSVCTSAGGTWHPDGMYCECPESSAGGGTSVSSDPRVQMAGELGAMLGTMLRQSMQQAALRRQLQQQMKLKLQQQRIEAQRLHKIEEARQLDAMISRLERGLKLEGTPHLALKLGDEASAGYGICGLPGLATGGERPGCPTSQPQAGDVGGLRLKMGAPQPATLLALPSTAAQMTPEQAADLFAKLPPAEQEKVLAMLEKQGDASADDAKEQATGEQDAGMQLKLGPSTAQPSSGSTGMLGRHEFRNDIFTGEQQPSAGSAAPGSQWTQATPADHGASAAQQQSAGAKTAARATTATEYSAATPQQDSSHATAQPATSVSAAASPAAGAPSASGVAAGQLQAISGERPAGSDEQQSQTARMGFDTAIPSRAATGGTALTTPEDAPSDGAVSGELHLKLGSAATTSDGSRGGAHPNSSEQPNTPATNNAVVAASAGADGAADAPEMRDAVAGLPLPTRSLPPPGVRAPAPHVAPGAGADAQSGTECPPREQPVAMKQPVDACGILPEHAPVFTIVAREQCEVIVVQNVNRASAAWLRKGYIPKPMEVKTKTETAGAAAGLVLADIHEPCLRSSCEIKLENGIPEALLADKLHHLPFTSDYDLMAIGKWRGSGALGAVISDAVRGNLTLDEHETLTKLNLAMRAANAVINASEQTTLCTDCDFVLHGPANRARSEVPQKFPACAFEPNGAVRVLEDRAAWSAFFSEKRSAYNIIGNESWSDAPSNAQR